MEITAGTFNAFVDAARAHQAGRHGLGRTTRPDFRQSNIVVVRNDSGADLDRYKVEYVEQDLTPAELFWQQLSERVSMPGAVGRSDTVAALRVLARPILAAVSEVASLQDPRHLYYKCLGCGALD